MVFLDPGEKIDILQKVCATQGLTSFGWYCFFFTCGFNSRNAGIKWFKEHSVKFGGKDTELLCLKYWASLVSGCFDSTSHWNLWNWHCVASLREQFAATAGRQTLFEVCSVCSGFPSLMLFAWFASCAWKNGSTQHATSTNSLLKVLFCRNIVFCTASSRWDLDKKRTAPEPLFQEFGQFQLS